MASYSGRVSHARLDAANPEKYRYIMRDSISLILEGHISLVDAMDLKIQKAAQEGIIFFPLSQRLTVG